MTEEVLSGILSSTAGGLQDHRAIDLVRSLHDSDDLLHVVDVVGRNAIGYFPRRDPAKAALVQAPYDVPPKITVLGVEVGL